AIAVGELDPTAHLTFKHDQLTSERGILSLKPADRPERRNQQSQKEEEQRGHRGRRYVIPSPDQSACRRCPLVSRRAARAEEDTDEVFGTHRLIWCALIGLFRSRAALEAEILVLRHQLNVLRRKSPKRLVFHSVDRLVFAALYGMAPGVLDALKILKPQTVIRWHRAGFRAY